MSTPLSQINVCSGVPLNNRYDHTFYFSSAGEQFNYFSARVVKTFTKYSYIRRSWKLKVDATMNEARVWSYLYFFNGVGGKIYYYFINQIEYINDSTVELSLELDVLQTYMFEWNLNPCFVEREHSVTDNPGENTVNEGLDVGDYVIPRMETIDLSSLGIMVASTMDIMKYYATSGETEDNILGARVDGVFGGFQVTITDMASDWDELSVLLNYLNSKGKLDTIFAMWMYPKRLVNSNVGTFAEPFARYVSGSSSFIHQALKRPTTLDNYTPKNKKLLQYPYCFLYATNNNGGAAIYHYEHFTDGNPQFKVSGNISPDAIVKLTPLYYKRNQNNVDESLVMGGFPVCAWNSDTYKLWLAQNQNQQNLGLAMSGLKIVGGVAAIAGGVMATGGTGGAAGAVGFAGVSSGIGLISSGATEIAGQLAQRADADVQPPQSRGTYSGAHNIANGYQNFNIQHKTIDTYHARMIDDFFTMYGYATRIVKVPNISARPAFNYVKTIGSNITGSFCVEDIKRINEIFDKGVTFWKNGTIGNYSQNNSPN